MTPRELADGIADILRNHPSRLRDNDDYVALQNAGAFFEYLAAEDEAER